MPRSSSRIEEKNDTREGPRLVQMHDVGLICNKVALIKRIGQRLSVDAMCNHIPLI